MAQAAVKLYRKKAVTIEAMELHAGNVEEVSAWIGDPRGYVPLQERGEVIGLIIPTLEGDMFARFGSFIVKGVQGEFYPVKPDIFEATYETGPTLVRRELDRLMVWFTDYRRQREPDKRDLIEPLQRLELLIRDGKAP